MTLNQLNHHMDTVKDQMTIANLNLRDIVMVKGMQVRVKVRVTETKTRMMMIKRLIRRRNRWMKWEICLVRMR